MLPAGWVNPERPGERTVISAQVCRGVEKSWWENTGRHRQMPDSVPLVVHSRHNFVALDNQAALNRFVVVVAFTKAG